jgi:hypothetical protein
VVDSGLAVHRSQAKAEHAGDVAGLGPEGSSGLHEDLDIVLALSDRDDFGIILEIAGGKLDRRPGGDHQRSLDQVVTRAQPNVADPGGSAIVRQIVELDPEERDLEPDLHPVARRPAQVEEGRLGDVPSLEEVGYPPSVEKVTLLGLLKHESNTEPALAAGQGPRQARRERPRRAGGSRPRMPGASWNESSP